MFLRFGVINMFVQAFGFFIFGNAKCFKIFLYISAVNTTHVQHFLLGWKSFHLEEVFVENCRVDSCSR